MRNALILLVLLLAALGPVGCLSAPGAEETDAWRFGGAFARNYTQSDVQAVCEAGAGPGATCEMAMSDPPRFGFRFEGRAACEAAREKVLRVPHVAGVTPCAREQGAAG